jgi:hypothetical protein
MGRRRIRLTRPQISALVCSGLEFFDDDDQELLNAWNWGEGKALEFEESDAESIFSALVGLANAEDDWARDPSNDRDMRTLAARASRSLGCVASKVIRSS